MWHINYFIIIILLLYKPKPLTLLTIYLLFIYLTFVKWKQRTYLHTYSKFVKLFLNIFDIKFSSYIIALLCDYYYYYLLQWRYMIMPQLQLAPAFWNPGDLGITTPSGKLSSREDVAGGNGKNLDNYNTRMSINRGNGT